MIEQVSGMRAGVGESCPIIIHYHMRSHPEADSHCDRPFATHPPPVWTARRAQDFWPLLLLRDDADNWDQANCALLDMRGVRSTDRRICRRRPRAAEAAKSPDT